MFHVNLPLCLGKTAKSWYMMLMLKTKPGRILCLRYSQCAVIRIKQAINKTQEREYSTAVPPAARTQSNELHATRKPCNPHFTAIRMQLSPSFSILYFPMIYSLSTPDNHRPPGHFITRRVFHSSNGVPLGPSIHA